MTHPTLEELLDLRDGEGNQAAETHLATCADCAAELGRLRRVASELRGLPVETPAHDRWPTIASRLAEDRWQRRWLRAGMTAAAVFLLITVVAGVRGGVESWREARTSRQTQELVSRSQELEDTLRAFERSNVVSGRTASAMMQVEDQIAAIDSRLTQLQREKVNDDSLLALWQQRVNLLDTLVSLHASPPTYAGL